MAPPTCQASSSCDSSNLRWMASSNWLFRDIMSFLLLTNSASIRFFLPIKGYISFKCSYWKQVQASSDILDKITSLAARVKQTGGFFSQHHGGAESHFAIASSRSLIACLVVSAFSCELASSFFSLAFSCRSKMFWRRKELGSDKCVKLKLVFLYLKKCG